MGPDEVFQRLMLSALGARRALRQRQQRFPVLFLSTGGTCWHADKRRMSIAAAIQWALENNLQGLVLDSGAVQEQSQAVAMARSKGLKVGTECMFMYAQGIWLSASQTRDLTNDKKSHEEPRLIASCHWIALQDKRIVMEACTRR